MQANSQVVVNGGGGSNADMWSRGKKRRASDSNLSDFERFEKRLRLLSIRNSEQNHNRNGRSNHPDTRISNAPAPSGILDTGHVRAPPEDGHMQVDETRDTVFIHDLDAELADTAADEDKLIFLPDIEKQFTKIPQQVLTGGRYDDRQELVLYGAPKSLTVDEDHDSVRKAIIDARHRAREKAIEEARQEDMNRTYDHSAFVSTAEPAHGYSNGYEEEPDTDAMDID